jgi:hypothetical protein
MMECLVEWKSVDSEPPVNQSRYAIALTALSPFSSTAALRRAALGADTASPGSDYFCAAAI